MNCSESEPLVVGCHHKTGTNLALKLLDVIASCLWGGMKNVTGGRYTERKLPLSSVLKRCQGSNCYLSIWFEHEIDVPPSSIRFLHFVRHPAKWVRSAYLYHKGTAVCDRVRWMEWRIFRRNHKQVSYIELLREVDDATGILLEAIRSYPEIAGTARAASTGARLAKRHRVSLEQFHDNFDSSVETLCAFVGLDTKNHKIEHALRAHDISAKNTGERLANATRYSPRAEYLERYLLEDPGFRKLYDEPASQMGFSFDNGSLQSRSILGDVFVSRILDAKPHLLTHCDLAQAHQALGSDWLGSNWLTYALQTFGEGGHLMMYPFIQSFMDELEAQPSTDRHSNAESLAI
jgi:hypothetical protein